ncbi:hypothetical protein [Variovorax sp. YR216]|uniref:hypothetical protein n=1 Tax=Variovorax sp. YR216 TaxID=1882828 RepID=UPI00089C67EB|nr:hypothetical protein [Variovorax sp. YR216]SEB22413.1 hypothetical protein SAMN05444680_11635 [Variovorax sp. YR216]
MSTFARKFSLTSLEENPPVWWAALLKQWAPSGSQGEDGLRFAVRNNSCNFYIRGQSVGLIDHDQQLKPRLLVSRKYVDQTATIDDPVLYGADDAPDLAAIVEVAKTKCDKEKSVVDRLVGSNIDVIDLEMGLPASYLGWSSSRRIDLVSLERRDGKILLVFWEVKLVDDGRLVSQTRPKVLDQMERYTHFLREASEHIVKAYANACATLAAVHTAAKALRPDIAPLSGLLSEVVANPAVLAIDGAPRLLVFGEADKRKRGHLEKLAREFPLLHIESEESSLQLRFVAVEGS